MKKILLILITNLLFSLDIDLNLIKNNIKNNPKDIKDRLILSKYYLQQKDYNLSYKYLKEALKINPKNRLALKLKYKLDYLIFINKVKIKYKNINNYINYLYEKQKYKELLSTYIKYPNLKYNKDSLIKIARVAMWEGKYDLSLKILSKFKEKDLDIYEIKAYDYYYKGDLKKANRLFKILFYSTGNKDFGLKAIETSISLGDIIGAKKILLLLKNKIPKEKLQEINSKLKNLQNKYLKNLLEKYKKNPTFENLQPLAIELFSKNPKKAIDLVKKYISSHPTDNKAKLLIAKLYSWNNNLTEAKKYLLSILSNNYEAKLLYGKILSWNGEFKEALKYLKEVEKNGNQKEQYEAKKSIAFIKMWQNKNKEAKQLFLKLLKENPKDTEVKEALMMLNHNIKPLIKKYSKLYSQNPDNETVISKLANLYELEKNYPKAIFFYEKLLKKHPENIELYKTLGDLYLNIKKFYKGFGYWEYYAAFKNDKKTYLELAKRYYWYNFNKQALDILDKILQKDPTYKPALLLKAQILKINPRFTLDKIQNQIRIFYQDKSKELLPYADRSYFNGLYENAAKYYKRYIFLNPNDNEVRERYAFSLEYSKHYLDAAGEFFNLLWFKNSPIIKYHYAYNLQKGGKLKQALKVYKELLNSLPQKVPPKILKFIEKWKKAWESMKFEKYEKFYDEKIKNNIYWRFKKQNIFKNAWFISVAIYDPLLIKKEGDIYVVRFYQEYASRNVKDKGYKTLWIKCNEEGCKIIKEIWQKGKYKPYNSSLRELVIKNIQLINQQLKNKTLSPTNNKNFIPLENIIKVKKKIKKNDVVLAVKVKRETNTTKIKENLNLVYLKKIKITKKTSITKELRTNNFYSYDLTKNKFFIKFYHFHDNQKTHYNETQFYYLKYQKGIYGRFFSLTQNRIKKAGKSIAFYQKSNQFSLKLGIDKISKNNLFFNFNISPFTITYENLIFTRKSICSDKYKKIGLQISDYIQISQYKNIWYSLEEEYISDKNLVFTPQFEYNFYENKIINIPYSIYLSGWYQFNKQTNNCYYSPKKADNTIIGVNIYPYKFSLKSGIGYSFFDKNLLYLIGIKYNSNIKNFNLNFSCQYSNSQALKTSNNYKSYECYLQINKKW